MIEWIVLGGLSAYAFLAKRAAQQLDDPSDVDGAYVMQYSAGVVALARAIARQENSDPRHNNPGDLARGDIGFGTFGVEKLTVYADQQTGWDALYRQLQLIADGKSHVYTRSMSLSDMATHYAPGDSANWAANVAAFLGVSPATTLDTVFG